MTPMEQLAQLAKQRSDLVSDIQRLEEQELNQTKSTQKKGK
jgi:hypothetical protein